MILVQDWKKGSKLFEGHRPYDPTVAQASALPLEDYPMKFVTVAVDRTKKGVHQLSFSLPNSVRIMYQQDHVRAPEWKQLIVDFDRKFLGKAQTWPLLACFGQSYIQARGLSRINCQS